MVRQLAKQDAPDAAFQLNVGAEKTSLEVTFP